MSLICLHTLEGSWVFSSFCGCHMVLGVVEQLDKVVGFVRDGGYYAKQPEGFLGVAVFVMIVS